MQRRDFLTNTGVLAAAAGTLLLASCNSGRTDKTSDDTQGETPGFELDELNIAELGELMKSGRYSSEQLVDHGTRL